MLRAYSMFNALATAAGSRPFALTDNKDRKM